MVLFFSWTVKCKIIRDAIHPQYPSSGAIGMLVEHDLHVLPNGDLIGSGLSGYSSDFYPYVAKLDSFGQKIWQKALPEGGRP